MTSYNSRFSNRIFVERHHYSKSYPAARFRFGLIRGDELVGVAVFSVPMSVKVLDVIPGTLQEKAELGRFVLLDKVPGNGETWFLAQCCRRLRDKGLNGIVSFSDPVPRVSSDGRLLMPGHVGTIYQAFNAIYLGRATARTLRILPDGRVFSDRTAQKIRKLERGWEYAAKILQSFGAVGTPHTEGDEPDTQHATRWLNSWLSELTRPIRHPGNLKYAFVLNKRLRRFFPESRPYLKKIDL